MSISIKEILSLSVFKDAQLVAGHLGTHKQVRWVTILEVLDDIDQLESGELLITTAFDLLSNTELRMKLIEKLYQRNLAGIGIQTGYYLESIPDEIIRDAEKYQFPVIEIPRTTTFSDITKIIHKHIINRQFEKIQFSEELYKRLTDIALNNEGIQPIAKAVCHLINGKIVIFDTHMNELCVATCPGAPFSVSHDVLLDYIYQYRDKFEAGTIPYISIPQNDDYLFITPVKSKNSHFGYIAGIKKQPFNEFEEIAIQHASTIGALEFIKLSSLEEKDNQLKADFMELVLTGNYTDELTVYAKGEALGYKIGTHDTCATIMHIDDLAVIDDWDRMESKVLQAILKILQEHGLETLFKLYSGQFVMLITNRWVNRVDIREVLQEVARHINEKFEITLSIGIGDYYKDFRDYKKSYKEAQEALFIIQSVWKKNKCLHYKDLGLYKLLLPILQDEKLIMDYYHQVLGEILDSDELLETLDVYLQSMKINEAADQLFIHRHTLKYRIKKIEELTGRKINHFQDRLEFELALIIHNMKSNESSA